MIGAFRSATTASRKTIVDPGLLRYRDRAALRILYRADVATTAQLVTLVYHRRQTAQQHLSVLFRAGLLERAVLPPEGRGGAPVAYRLSPRARRGLGYGPLTRGRAGTQLRHSLNVVETVCAFARAGAPDPTVQGWLTEPMATDLLPDIYPDSVVILQVECGSGVVFLEIDQSTEHGPEIRDKLARYGPALDGKAGWQVVFVVGSRERAAFVARIGGQDSRWSGAGDRASVVVLSDLRASGLGAMAVSLSPAHGSRPFRTLLSDSRTRRCGTPVGTESWLRLLAAGGDEGLDELLR